MAPMDRILIFDGQSETLLAILANHEQACPFWDAVHDEQLNRLNTFDFSIPADHESAAYVVEGNLAAYMDPDGDWQLFQIVRVEDVRSDTPGVSIRNVYCETAANELLDEIITDVRPNGVSAQFALMQALQGTRWQVGQVDNLGQNSTNFYYEPVLSAVQKILNTWGGQVKYRVTMQGNRIAGRFIDIRASRGQDRGRVFRYGKGLVQPRRVVDTSNVKTALYGRGKGQQSADNSDTRITFADVVWSKANGDPVDKPAGQEWVGDPDALAQWGRDGGTRHRFGIYENPDTTDPAQLLQQTWEALQQQKTPLFSYEAQVIDLERIPGYEDEAVRLGDTVRVIDETFNPPLDLWATVVEVKRNLMEPLKTEITLGNFLPLITDDGQRLRQIEASLHDNQGIWDSKLGPGDKIQTSWLDGVINVLNNELQSTGGYVYVTDQDGILVLDKPRDQNPTKALQLKGGVFAISDQKDANGNWVWRTFGDGTGFTASELKTGTLLASLVNILAGNYVRLDGNGLTVTDASNVQQVQLGQYAAGKYGLLVMNGEIYSTYISTRPPGVTKSFAELTTGGTLNIYDTNGLLGMSVGGGSGQGRLIWYLSGTMYADSEIDSGSTRDLLIRSLTSGSGIQLQAIPSGNKITIGSGGQNGVYITAGTTDMSGNAHVGGSLVVTGTFIANGGKNAAQETKNYGTRLLSVIEAPDVRYQDAGIGILTNGECRITLDPVFLECIEPHSETTPWYVHITTYADVGLYVAEIGADYFIVRERGGGTTTGAQFAWSLSAVRVGYAGVRLPPFESPIEPAPQVQTASATALATSTMSVAAS